MPDYFLRKCVLEDGLDHLDDPGIMVLLTGDGACYYDGAGFHAALERLQARGWRVEILSWAHSCNQRMREWAQSNGVFVALDDFYEAITFLEPSRPGHEFRLRATRSRSICRAVRGSDVLRRARVMLEPECLRF